MTRRGFTLVEMLIALVILSVVAAGLTRVLQTQQRLAVTQVEQASMQGNVRNGIQILSSELRELATSPGGASDITTFTSNTLRYRAMRSLALACAITRTQVKIRVSPLFGPRGIVAGQDSMLLFAEGDPGLSADDKWVAAPITSVTAGATCGSAPAIQLATTLDTMVAPLSAYRTDAPLRTFEVMELGPVIQGAESWLGARSASGGQALTPVVGPLAANGLRFSYLDSLGNVTGTLNRIRAIQVTLTGRSDRNVRRQGTPGTVQRLSDSMVVMVSLRNTPRP